MVTLTYEQEARRDILYDLYNIIGTTGFERAAALNGNLIYLNDFDLKADSINLVRLVKEGILDPKSYRSLKRYPMVGYILTKKAKQIYANPARWVFSGEWENDSTST